VIYSVTFPFFECDICNFIFVYYFLEFIFVFLFIGAKFEYVLIKALRLLWIVYLLCYNIIHNDKVKGYCIIMLFIPV